METISVVCPLYNSASKYESIKKLLEIQKNIIIDEVLLPVTESKDNSFEIYKGINNSNVFKIGKFSHSLVREDCIKNAKNKIVILITDDIEANDPYLFSKLVNDINNGFALSFARQIAKHKHIEKYIREINYPAESYEIGKNDIENKGLKAFFCSDVCMAYNKEIFTHLGGYDELDLPTNEDMYYARKVLLNDYKIKYNADAAVMHSHKYRLKTLFKRYFAVGKFFSKCPEFKEYKSNESGLSLAFKVFGKIIRHFDLIALFEFIPNMATRFLGTKCGEEAKTENGKSRLHFYDLLIVPLFLITVIFICYVGTYATSRGYIGFNPIIYSILIALFIGMLIAYLVFQFKDNKSLINKLFAVLFLILIIENAIVILCQNDVTSINATIRVGRDSLLPQMSSIFDYSGLAIPTSLKEGDVYKVLVDTSSSYKFFGIFMLLAELCSIYLALFILPKKLKYKRLLNMAYIIALIYCLVLVISSYVIDASSYSQIFQNFLKPEMFSVTPPPSSFRGEHNAYATALILIMFIVMLKNLKKNHWWNYLIIAFLFINIFLSLSKGGIITSLIMIFGYVVIVLYNKFKDSKKAKITIFSVSGTIVGLVLVVLLISLISQGKIIPSIYNNLVKSKTILTRVNIWQNTIELLNQNGGWIFGRGYTLVSRSLYTMNSLNGDFVYLSHNGFLQLVSYGGIIMLLVFISLIAYCIKVSLKLLKTNKVETITCYVVAFAFILYSIIESNHCLILVGLSPILYISGENALESKIN